MKQLVSILIPVYNAEKWLSGCIESALAQTWQWKEIIIVDDGSRDGSLEIAHIYAAQNVKVLTQENRGASAARNHALSLAQGDYIQWLDADDLLAPDKVSIQLEGSEPGQSSRVLLSGAWGNFYHRPENSNFVPDRLWEDLEPVEWLYRKVAENLWMAPIAWLVSRKLTEMAGPWNESLSLDDDGEYFCRVLSSSTGTRFFRESRCFKRETFGLSNNITLNDRKLESQLNSLIFHIQALRSMEDSPRTRDASVKLLCRWAIYFYPERPDLFKRMQAMVTDLDGHLKPPRLKPEYQWIQKLFGWKIAKKAQFTLPALRSIARKNRERLHL